MALAPAVTPLLDPTLAARGPSPSGVAANAAEARAAAEEMEAFFLAHAMDLMGAGRDVEAPFGGGSGERAFQGFLNDAYAKAVVAAGGIGLADALMAAIIGGQTDAGAPPTAVNAGD